MALPKKPKAKPRPKSDDKAQFERFVETARRLGVEEVGPAFDEAFKKIVPPNPRSVSR
jgi:hypothetical protein